MNDIQDPKFRLVKVPVRAKKVKWKNKDIQTYVFGNGSTDLLMLPSFPHSGIYYQWLLSKHDLSEFRIITFDLPGWIGNSDDYASDEAYHLEDGVEIAKKVLQAYACMDVVVMGYSFGTALGLRLTRELNLRVKRLVLVSPYICGYKGHRKGIFIRWLRNSGWFWMVKLYLLARMFYYEKLLVQQGLDKTFITYYWQLTRRADARILIESLFELIFTDWSCYLGEISPRTKVLVVSSKEEDDFIRQQAKLVRRRLDGEFSLLIHGGHHDFLLQPKYDDVEKIINFLSKD